MGCRLIKPGQMEGGGRTSEYRELEIMNFGTLLQFFPKFKETAVGWDSLQCRPTENRRELAGRRLPSHSGSPLEFSLPLRICQG